MKSIAYRLSLLVYALLPATLQFKARNLYRKFRPGIPAVDAATVWARYMDENLFEKVKSEFDSSYYSSKYKKSADDAWNDYLAHGIPVGRFINLEHELRFMGVGVNIDPTSKTEQIEFTLHDSQAKSPLVSNSDREMLSQVELLSIDLWDTLIRRNRPADACKLATARRILHLGWDEGILKDKSSWEIFSLRVDIEARIARSRSSQEYELSEVLMALLTELGFKNSLQPLVELLVSTEVDEEILWSEVIQDSVNLIQEIDALKVIASDFYMSSEHLQRIVSELVPDLAKVKVHSSCDEQASKRLNGELFSHLRTKYGVGSSQHIHIGDNLESDVKNQVTSGGRAIHVRPIASRHAGPGELTKKNVAQTFLNLDAIVGSQPSTSSAFSAGQEASQFAVALVTGAIEEALKQGVDVVHYISREGYFLKQIHDQIAPIISQNKDIAARHLTVSRRATFGPSLDCSSTENLLEDLGRLWSMYSNQSVKALLVSIGLDSSKYVDSLTSFQLELDERIQDLAADARFVNWISSPNVISEIQNELNLNRRALNAYLDEALEVRNGKVVVADIGWRGSIQDNLGRLLSNVSFYGVYLGLFPYLNEQLKNHSKRAVVFDGNKGEKYFYAEPPAAIERPWTPHIPSVVKFAINDSDELFTVTEIEKGEVSDDVTDFQRGSIVASELVAKWVVAHGYSADDLRGELQLRLEEYYQKPSTAVAGIWFDSSHDDSFGALNQTSFLKFRPDRTWIENPNSEAISAAQASSLWPHGYAAWAPVKALMTLMPSQKDGI